MTHTQTLREQTQAALIAKASEYLHLERAACAVLPMADGRVVAIGTPADVVRATSQAEPAKISAEHAAILDKQVADWTKERDRLQDLIAHATGGSALLESQAEPAEVQKLKRRVSELEAARIAYANEFPPTADGDPDVGNIHANIRALKAASAPLSQPHQAVVAAGVPTVLVEQVRAAMKRAYGLGQTYWQQADSEYVSQHKKSEATAQRFRDLNESICAMLAAAPLPPAPAPVERAICPHGCTSPENGGSGCMAVTGDCAMSAPPVGQALDLAAIRDQVLDAAEDACEQVEDACREYNSKRWPEMQDSSEAGAAACLEAIRALRSAPVNPVSENGGTQ